MRYLSQRYAMPDPRIQGLLTDIGTEELGHLEMIAAIIHQLTRNLTDDQLQKDPVFASYFVDHTTGVYPTASSGFPWTAASIGVKGDPICDLTEDLAAEGAMRKTQPEDSDDLCRGMPGHGQLCRAGVRVGPFSGHGQPRPPVKRSSSPVVPVNLKRDGGADGFDVVQQGSTDPLAAGLPGHEQPGKIRFLHPNKAQKTFPVKPTIALCLGQLFCYVRDMAAPIGGGDKGVGV